MEELIEYNRLFQDYAHYIVMPQKSYKELLHAINKFYHLCEMDINDEKYHEIFSHLIIQMEEIPPEPCLLFDKRSDYLLYEILDFDIRGREFFNATVFGNKVYFLIRKNDGMICSNSAFFSTEMNILRGINSTDLAFDNYTLQGKEYLTYFKLLFEVFPTEWNDVNRKGIERLLE